LHVHERKQIVAIIDWKTKQVLIRPRIRTIDIAKQKQTMRTNAIARHTSLFVNSLPIGAIHTIFTFY